jgi:hypothetical protein
LYFLIDFYVQKRTLKNSDGYALFNVSFLKTFFNVSEKKALDSAKDSLGMARSFAVQANQKSTKVVENAKSIQKYLKPLLEKAQKDKVAALKISETAFGISDKSATHQCQRRRRSTNGTEQSRTSDCSRTKRV